MAPKRGKSDGFNRGFIFVVMGVALALLVTFGPIVFGKAFDPSFLKAISIFFIVTGGYLCLGVFAPSLLGGGVGAIISRIFVAIIKAALESTEGGVKEGKENPDV